jgi:hypothetical protein
MFVGWKFEVSWPNEVGVAFVTFASNFSAIWVVGIGPRCTRAKMYDKSGLFDGG